MRVIRGTPVSKELDYHLTRDIQISKNVFRYGSHAWAELIREARKLYNEGMVIELDDDEYYMMESRIADVVCLGNKYVLLETPMYIWDRPDYYEVYVSQNNEIVRLEFTKESTNETY